MKILHLIDIPWWSGPSAYAFDCLLAHKQSGHQVVLLAERRSLPLKKARQLGIETVEMGGRKFWNAPENFLKAGLAARRLKADCIVVHTGSTHYLGILWGKILGIPVIRTRAIAQKVKSGILSRFIYSNTARTVLASRTLKRDFDEKFPQFANRSVVLNPPIAKLDLAGSIRASKSNSVGVLARLDPNKGHFEILDAMVEVQKLFPHCELHIAGSEENLSWPDLLAQARLKGLKNIYYHGFLPHEETGRFLAMHRMGVIASRGSEEVSRALLEWMSAGRPVIATKVGCIPEILEEGKGGYLVNPLDVALLAERIQRLMADPELAKKMGDFNLEAVVKYFEGSKFNQGWEQLLNAEVSA